MVATLSCALVELEQSVQAQHGGGSQKKLEHMMIIAKSLYHM
jgi:hypothetical protein